MDSVVQRVFEERASVGDYSTPKVDAQHVADEFGVAAKEARIMVIGSGGAGNNTVTRLTQMGIRGATTLIINTDAKHLSISQADKKMLIGKELTRGLGAGGYPQVGMKAAEESHSELKKQMEGVDMVYICTGLGGGTGTGSSPVLARIAKEMGAIVIGCVTMPFKIEGARIGRAEDGLGHLRQMCDTVIVIENDRLLKIAGDLPLQQAFAVADNLVATIIKGITETISQPSLVNLDYADVKTIMHSGGVAAVGFGESDTKNRAEESVIKAMSNPLLEVNYDGGTGALIHITGGPDLKLDEVNLIGEYVSKQLDPDAPVIWGARIDNDFKGKIRVITIVTGVKSPYILGPAEREASANGQHVRDFSQELGIKMVR
ncbi:MAG: cell division protein FtsZ [Nanoarchaeota archaeon]|nr:cell division protein FtsZ [Nanoarchaeota archaeon]